jgi:hypothetical protein
VDAVELAVLLCRYVNVVTLHGGLLVLDDPIASFELGLQECNVVLLQLDVVDAFSLPSFQSQVVDEQHALPKQKIKNLNTSLCKRILQPSLLDRISPFFELLNLRMAAFQIRFERSHRILPLVDFVLQHPWWYCCMLQAYQFLLFCIQVKPEFLKS